MIALELAAYAEKLADPQAADYERLSRALGNPPLYHQWRTYQEKAAAIIVNSFNTGTGKTKGALLRLLDLHEEYRSSRSKHQANVLFIAPTNELLRQHEEDVREFIARNELAYHVLRLDAATITALGQTHLGETVIRQGDRLHRILRDPAAVLTDETGLHPEGQQPYVLVINPDIFYYALYGLGNPHERRLLFRDFVQPFRYIIIDEFHYYNAKQLANFFFFLTLSREWGFFAQGRQICLLTATPTAPVREYLHLLDLDIAFITPETAPADLPTTPALAPVHLRVYSAEALENGLVSLATGTQEKAQILAWLQKGKHGAFISNALWRINWLYQEYGGRQRADLLGRLTGAERPEARKANTLAPLLLATPTVDIGYNFARPGKRRQSIDFLLFDARFADECLQRLGRAGRVLGKPETNSPGEVWAVVPEQLVTELAPLAGQTLERQQWNALVNATLPSKNSIVTYIRSGAIAEAFLPLYHYWKSLPEAEKARAHRLYDALLRVYDIQQPPSFEHLCRNTARYLACKQRLPQALQEVNTRRFGPGSVALRLLDEMPNLDVAMLEQIDSAYAQQVEQVLLTQGAREAELQRLEEIEAYYVTEARFHFRENFQPPLALVHDPQWLLASADYTVYSALHIVQNYRADWMGLDEPEARQIIAQVGKQTEKTQFLCCCHLKRPLDQRLRLVFTLSGQGRTRRQWEERYCSRLAAQSQFHLSSEDGPVPGELNALLEQRYLVFYAVPAIGPEALALLKFQRVTALSCFPLRVDFGSQGEQEYLLVLGSAALLLSYEESLRKAKYLARRKAAQGSHIFDWEEL
jgi:CRISPR-associated endonuclease/helicase Cas3